MIKTLKRTLSAMIAMRSHPVFSISSSFQIQGVKTSRGYAAIKTMISFMISYLFKFFSMKGLTDAMNPITDIVAIIWR